MQWISSVLQWSMALKIYVARRDNLCLVIFSGLWFFFPPLSIFVMKPANKRNGKAATLAFFEQQGKHTHKRTHDSPTFSYWYEIFSTLFSRCVSWEVKTIGRVRRQLCSLAFDQQASPLHIPISHSLCLSLPGKWIVSPLFFCCNYYMKRKNNWNGRA